MKLSELSIILVVLFSLITFKPHIFKELNNLIHVNQKINTIQNIEDFLNDFIKFDISSICQIYQLGCYIFEFKSKSIIKFKK